MKRILFIFSLLLISLLGFSQTKGDWLIGLNSNLSNVPLRDISFSEHIGYQVSNQWQVGGSFNFQKDADVMAVLIRYYPTKCHIKDNIRSFMSAGTTVSFNDDYNNVSLGVGLTGFINKTIYIEPSVNFINAAYPAGNYWKFTTNIAIGIRI